MFRGRFEYTIDAKGRLSIPARFREALRARGDERVMVTNYFESCLAAYPLDVWRIIEDELGRLSMFRREVRTFQRFFIASAVELSLDKQGRILVPPALRGYASLEHDIVLLGLVNKFEIWSRARWEEELSFDEGSLNEAARVLAELDLKI